MTGLKLKSPAAITHTLDENGSLDGLPFMPEMAEMCGQRFRVMRQAEKTCFEVSHGAYTTREFLNNDVFLLKGLRCSGTTHDGCQRLCAIFWKRAWLKKVEEGHASPAFSPCEMALLTKKLKTKSSATRYFCQSTAARESYPTGTHQAQEHHRKIPSRHTIRRCGRLGNDPAFDRAFRQKNEESVFRQTSIAWNLAKDPRRNPALQPGEIVEIKTIEEMQATLDGDGRNRGLICDLELRKFCGRNIGFLAVWTG